MTAALSTEALVQQLFVDSRQTGWSLSGDAAALLARRLIEREVAVGGPYKNDVGVVEPVFNRMIALLLHRLGSPMPNLEIYLSSAQQSYQPDRQHESPLTLIQHTARAVLARSAPPLRTIALHAFTSILRIDKAGEISQLSDLFEQSLVVRPPYSATAQLGVANVLTWISYSIYDDFIDDEGVPNRLPVANLAHREAVRLYMQVVPSGMPVDPYMVFAGMDEANAWEAARCRFSVTATHITVGALPSYGSLIRLAARARAHVLGPMIVMERSGVTAMQRQRATKALDDYLIARQLNDDLHDWVEDFKRGHISPVVAWLLREARVTRVDYDQTELLNRLRILFWRSGLNEWSRRARFHIVRAERELVICGVLMPDSLFITTVLRPIADGLERGLARHAQDERFLAAYSSSLPRDRRPK